MTIDNVHAPEFDVAIVGYGPVGQVLAALLGRAGHRVAVFERFGELYRLPRAVHLDHEIMRLLQSLGLSDVLAGEMVPVDDYRWFGADGELLLRFEPHSPAPSGWEGDYMFFQPELERAIDSHACVPAGVTTDEYRHPSRDRPAHRRADTLADRPNPFAGGIPHPDLLGTADCQRSLRAIRRDA